MNIKLVVFDFDGVFTDGKCYFDSNNNILKYYNIKDGMAIGLLKKNDIKCGLISSYNTKKNIILCEKENSEIIDHLKFDYKFVGVRNKLLILNEWMKELNISYNEIAYIGDDINDIEILERVKFSACPSDASIECQEIVDYVCKNKGGEACVREFVDIILSDNDKIKRKDIIQEMKKEAIYQLNNFNEDLNEIKTIVKLISESNKEKNIYMTGIGKSENIANHFCSLLKSININCFSLNAINALHGDIGTLKENDMIFLFSKSGNTSELLQLIPFLKERKCFIIGVCCDSNSKFSELCCKTIKLPFNCEISGEINKIPTNSYMSQLFFSNIIVSLLKNNIDINQYKNNHPAGNIGNNLKKINDSMIYKYPKLIVEDEIKLHDVLLEMTKYKIGCCFFVNEIDELFGILTDGDIRRLILNDENKKIINKSDINKNYYYETDTEKFIFECRKSNYIPIIINEKLYGIINNTFC
jgi:YrbI family 3-deoxy-D-manno-octulosonate 8-phosphate phosphatase